MSDEDLKASQESWQAKLNVLPEREEEFVTLSGMPIKPLYTPLDMNIEYERDLGFPGEYPYIRGVQSNMYRGRLWTMRQFSGYAGAEESNTRYRYLLAQGQTGLSVAFDLPTLMGLDSDAPMSHGEVGRCGVAVASLADMEVLFRDIPLGQVSTSMTINGPAAVIWAMYLVVAEKQGVSWKKLRGTLQNDILKEYIAQKSWIFPPRPSMRLITDLMAFAAGEVPLWNTISISGYHIREAGSTAVQELAFTLADGLAYVQAGIDAGLEVDSFAPRLSFFFDAHMDFFEEIAKFRAARRLWAKLMQERYAPKDPRSLMLRFHTQTAGCSLTAQQIENNIVRTALQALAAVMGGTQSLHTNSMDEVLALPTERAATIALRTQQVIALESGVASSIDPLAGSYLVESLTSQMEKEARAYIEEIDEQGGVIAAIEKGFMQREIARASYEYQKAVEAGKRQIVGVNCFQEENSPAVDFLKIPEEVEKRQVDALSGLRRQRDPKLVQAMLHALGEAARTKTNLMPPIIEAVKAYATLGEITAVLKEVFGEYHEPPVF